MLQNILAAAWRNAVRDGLYSVINVLGLALGLTAAILIALFVRDELSFDHFLIGYDRIYRVSTKEIYPTRTEWLADSVARLGPELALDFPEFEAVARIDSQDIGIRHGDVEGLETTAYWADPATLEVLGLPMVAGDAATALDAPDSVVLTRSMARKYFGTDTPIGETLEFFRKYPMRVTAVIEDLPSNTHLDIQILASARAPFSTLAIEDAKPVINGSRTYSPYTYVRLKPGVDPASLTGRLAQFADNHYPSQDNGDRTAFQLDPVGSIHLLTGTTGEILEGGSRTDLAALSLVGVLILVVACVNFINLMTARAGRRAIEVGVRKALGATQRQLLLHFIGEATGFVCVAALVAIAFVELALPRLDAFLDRQIGFAYWHDPALSLGLLALVAVVGMGAGAYPALILAALRPAIVLKGGRAGGSGGRLRQLLVVMQFAVSIGLGVATLVILRQTEFATGESLRFDKDETVVVKDKAACTDSFRNRVAALPGVRGVACSRAAPLDFSTGEGDTKLADGREVRTSRTAIDAGFFELYGLAPMAGRFFDRSRPSDSLDPASTANPTIVINETARRAFGFVDAAAAIGQTVTAKLHMGDYQAEPSTIIGVVGDFQIGSIRDKIQPTIFYVDPASWGMLSVKLDGIRIPEDLAGIDRIWADGNLDHPIQRSFLDQEIEKYYRGIVRDGEFFAGFAAIALVIGCLGLFGLSAFTAERRTKEIGIRKALGASSADVARLLVWQFARPVLIANAIAWPVAWFIMRRWLDGFAYHIKLDWQPFALAGAAALVIAVVTTLFHAFQVARARPVLALRYE